MNNKVTKLRPDPDERFSTIYEEMNDWLNMLMCATATLGSSRTINADADVRACRVVHICYDKLERIHNALDEWHVTHKHSAKS